MYKKIATVLALSSLLTFPAGLFANKAQAIPSVSELGTLCGPNDLEMMRGVTENFTVFICNNPGGYRYVSRDVNGGGLNVPAFAVDIANEPGFYSNLGGGVELFIYYEPRIAGYIRNAEPGGFLLICQNGRVVQMEEFVGFDNPNNFYRTFNRTAGFNPAYRSSCPTRR